MEILIFRSLSIRKFLQSQWEARNTRQLLIDGATRSGDYGTGDQDEAEDKERRRTYVRSKLGQARAQLKIVSQSYGDMVKTFLYQLTCSQDQGLHSLSFRLDFNSHYKKKDSRLSMAPRWRESLRRTSLSGYSAPALASTVQMATSLMTMQSTGD